MNTDLDGFNGDPELGKQKEASDSLNLTNEIIISWLGKRDSNLVVRGLCPNYVFYCADKLPRNIVVKIVTLFTPIKARPSGFSLLPNNSSNGCMVGNGGVAGAFASPVMGKAIQCHAAACEDVVKLPGKVAGSKKCGVIVGIGVL
jgi:hypothetical protein